MKRSFYLYEIIIVFTLTLLPLMAAVFFNFPLAAAMIPGFFILIYFAYQKQVPAGALTDSVKKGLYRNRNVAWLLVFIGLILPTWSLAGTIEDLNTLFLHFISPDYFLTIAFLITVFMSLTVGSAVGSLSIVGIPLMSAGLALNLPQAVIAGALVSGAFVGDRTSPLSSSFQLLAFSTELSVSRHFRAILPTMAATALLTAGLFLGMDTVLTSTGSPPETEPLAWSRVVSFVPPLLLLILILLGKDMKVCFLSAIAAGGLVLLFRGTTPSEWISGAISGTASLNGLLDMLPFVVFILIVGAFCQIIEDTAMLQPFLEKTFTDTVSLTKNTAQTVTAAAGVSLLSPNQSFPILLTGRALLPHWENHFHKRVLARTLADSTVVFAGLVPWSLLAILCSAIVGVPVIQYLPFAFFLLLSPFVTIVFSWVISRKGSSYR
jgi:Na+:H+ antiporter, NhaC family